MTKAARLRLLALALVLGAGAATWGWLAWGRSRGARTIVLVTVDTLRRDYVGAYSTSSPARTPRMDALAASGTRFADARAPAPLTLPSHATMLSGLPPALHGARTNTASRLPPRERRAFSLLAERLSNDGRRCAAFVSAGPLVKWYGLDAGFETYDDGDLDDRTGDLYAERTGDKTVERALSWVRSLPTSERAFLWVHLFEPHEPHPAGLSAADGYRADVEAADAAVGFLLDGLSAAGRGDAVVCVASDHGEALGDAGEESHGFLLPESVLRVPLILRGPGVPEGVVRDDPVALSDLKPTLEALASLSPEATAGGPDGGIDLLAERAPASRARSAEGLHAYHQHRWAQLFSTVAAGWKLEDRGLGRERLFRLNDLGPPWQDEGAPARGNPEAERLASALRAYRSLGDGAGSEPGAAPLGYGAGGAVGPLLDPRENAKRPDPYEVMGDAGILSEIAAGKDLPPSAQAKRYELLLALEARDPGNPAVHFWKGYYLLRRGEASPAAEAFARALALGRVDGDTLRLAMGARADAGDRKGALSLLATYEPRLYPDVRVHLLAAALWRDEGDPEKEKEACRKAVAASRSPRDEQRIAASGCR